MAAAMVGGSVCSAFFQVLFERLASREVVEFFAGKKVSNGLLKKLDTTITRVNGALDDAEEKQIKNSALRKLLDDLEADGLLDEIRYGALRPKLGGDQDYDPDCLSNAFEVPR